jgi:hypothetical protein
VGKPRNATQEGPSATRAQAASDALGSVRAEGLDPGRAEPLLAAWARDELTDAQLEEARLKILADRSLTVEELLSGFVRICRAFVLRRAVSDRGHGS